MIFYLLAFVFYLYVRIAHTLDLGGYVWYGVMVLMVEIMGASTTCLYGLNIVFRPVHEPARADPDAPGLVLVDHPYHVRVLVPVYKEDLDIVVKTINGARAAKLPAGCGRTVYLCDDGKDPAKRRWCEAAGDDVVYVSGRTRKPGEMNGKSANLNNCMAHVYPGGCDIPPSELVCIFDADQVANPDFFLKTVPLFDAGDDVGMVLSPQVRRGGGERGGRGGDGARFFSIESKKTSRIKKNITHSHHTLRSLPSVLLQPGPARRHLQPRQRPVLGVRADWCVCFRGGRAMKGGGGLCLDRWMHFFLTLSPPSRSPPPPFFQATTPMASSPAPAPTSWCAPPRSGRRGGRPSTR